MKRSTAGKKKNPFRFKAKGNMPSPGSDDSVSLTSLNFNDYGGGVYPASWSLKDMSDFLKLIEKISQELKKEKLKLHLASIQKMFEDCPSKHFERRIKALKRQIRTVHKLPLNMDLVLPLYEDYNWEEIAAELNNGHTAGQHKCLWYLYLHPSRNKRIWDIHERAKLQENVIANKHQDGDTIAKRKRLNKLKKRRTGKRLQPFQRHAEARLTQEIKKTRSGRVVRIPNRYRT